MTPTMPPDPDCIFCRIVEGRTEAQVIYRDDRILIIQDAFPQAPVHWLAIPQRHHASLSEFNDPNLLGHMLTSLANQAGKLGISDFRLVINSGAEAGQTIFHLHAHLLARRKMRWPPG